MLRISEMLESSWCMERDGAWQGMARGVHIHTTALLKRFKPQDLEGRTTELLQSAQPFLSFPGKSQETIPYYSRKIAPTSMGDLGGCGTHSIAKRAGGELENPSSVGWPGPALAISTAPTDTDQAQHHLLVPMPDTHSHHT